MNKNALTTALFFLLLISPAAAAAPGRTEVPPVQAVVGAAIVDVENGVILENRTVIVSGEKILRIQPLSDKAIPEDAKIIDGRGLFLIPALFDAHVHDMDPATFGPLMISHGILFVRDMGNATPDALALREGSRTGELFGPDMIVTGAILDGDPPSIPQISIPCPTPEAGREAVRAQAAAGVNQIKVYSGLRKDVFLAIADETRKLGLKMVGHIPEAVYIQDAAEAGLSSAEHVFGPGKIIAKLRGDPLHLAPKGMGTDIDYFLRLNEIKRDDFRQALHRIQATGMHICPTLVVFKHMAHLKEILAGDYAMLEYASPFSKELWKNLWGSQPPAEFPEALLAGMRDIVRELHLSGIPLMVGTDLLCPGVIPGYSVHEEMALWQDAGISPADILRAATIVPARFLGVDDRLGKIAEGLTASFLLTRENPLKDIRNAAQIENVFFRGRAFDRAELDRLQQDVKKAVQK